ncbi:DUF1194 domain-containing protein [Marinimicrococcus flavescens]|uniref:DUF1194 domain-containing protein n=1 Tax=Marinimicrococcus flavescens TaxID=3031815 RepID=A0AAP3UYD1_9PROT|nr:DUF1194 domain-containing protein [Marinimicrococcus flavescens]
MRAMILGILLLLGAAPPARAEIVVDVELVLAVDVSGSIDMEEARQQREGYIAAIRDAEVLAALGRTFTGRIAVAYVEWAGAEQQRLLVPWMLVEGRPSAEAFASALAEQPLARGRWTSISGAIDFAATLFDGNGYAGERLVIDVSGDGANNSGRAVADARDAAVDSGIVINGLPILNDRPQPFGMPTPMELNLDRYYREQVVGGPGAFLITALDFEDFRRAILNKLVREIAGRPARRAAPPDHAFLTP